MNLKTKLILIVVLLVNIQLFAQETSNVSGTVSDENNVPIPGVNIAVLNTARGIQTDFDGNYTIAVSDGEVLQFSYIGYSTQTVTINGQSSLNIVLLEDASQLEEVVVIGYGSRKKSDLLGSVASVKAEELAAFPVLDAQQALQGRAAGVDVQTNNGGEPGAAISIRIRGNGSLLANSAPLIVVDGFVSGTFPQANDIASIEVLKDAASTAIYGVQASGGVILVTTKKGTKGKLNVEINSTYAVQNTIDRLDLLNANEFGDYINQVRENVSLTSGDPVVPYVQGGGNTDWQDVIYRSGYTTNHQLAFSGGSENIKFYSSLNYFNQEGIVINSDFERVTFVTNVDANITDKLKAGVNFFGSIATQNSIQSQSNGSVTVGNDDVISLANRFAPDLDIFNPDGTFVLSDRLGNDRLDNPFGVANEIDNETERDILRANFFFEYELLKGLSLKSTLGLTADNNNTGRFVPSTLEINSGGAAGVATIFNVRQESLLTETFLTYTKDIGKGRLTLLGGYSFQDRTSEFFLAAGEDFISDNLSFRNLGAALNFLQPQSGITPQSFESVFARVNYDLDDKYLFKATIRNDRASVFAANNRSATFPSAAFAWRASNEDFLKDSKTISNLKFRISYGEVGNPGIGAFGSLAILNPLFASLNGEFVNAITPQRPENANLGFESSEQTNIGFDLGLFDNRISVTADYYSINTNDLLAVDESIPDFAGFNDSNILVNAGQLNNKGVELGINTVNIANENFNWSSNFNISFNRSEAVSLLNGLDLFQNGAPSFFSTDNNVITREGEQVGQFFGLDYQGVFQGGDFPEGTAGLTGAIAGDPLFADIDGDGAIGGGDNTIIGNPNPDFTFGFNNSFSYKNFDLNIFFQGTQGNDLFNLTNVILVNGDGNTTRDFFNNAWTPSNTNTNVPRVGNNSSREISSRFVEDGSYVRLKNLAFGYTFPSSVTEKLGMQSFRLSVSAQNLLTFTDYSGLDPEVNFFGAAGNNNQSQNTVRGFDFGNFPALRTVNFGVNLKF